MCGSTDRIGEYGPPGEGCETIGIQLTDAGWMLETRMVQSRIDIGARKRDDPKRKASNSQAGGGAGNSNCTPTN